MAKELSFKFKFICKVKSNKGKKIILIDHKSYSLFIELINPYIINEMKYKLP